MIRPERITEADEIRMSRFSRRKWEFAVRALFGSVPSMLKTVEENVSAVLASDQHRDLAKGPFEANSHRGNGNQYLAAGTPAQWKTTSEGRISC